MKTLSWSVCAHTSTRERTRRKQLGDAQMRERKNTRSQPDNEVGEREEPVWKIEEAESSQHRLIELTLVDLPRKAYNALVILYVK